AKPPWRLVQIIRVAGFRVDLRRTTPGSVRYERIYREWGRRTKRAKTAGILRCTGLAANRHRDRELCASDLGNVDLGANATRQTAVERPHGVIAHEECAGLSPFLRD